MDLYGGVWWAGTIDHQSACPDLDLSMPNWAAVLTNWDLKTAPLQRLLLRY